MKRSKLRNNFLRSKCSKGDKIIFTENMKCVSNDDELYQIFVASSPMLFLNFKFQV